MYTGAPRTCHICGEVEGRDATPEEIRTLCSPVKWCKEYKNGKWTGKWICTRCYNIIASKKRREATVHIPPSLKECGVKHNIIFRIGMGLPTCIERGTNQVIHCGAECGGCPNEKKE